MAHKSINKQHAREYLRVLNTGQKTPVSVAMELATRLGVVAEFNEAKDLKWTNTTFKYNAKLGEICAAGVGNSKKEAKQNSAKELIKMIENESETSPMCSSTRENASDESHLPFSSPMPSLSSSMWDSPCDRNVVGELQNLAAKRRWELPNYTFGEPTGEAHSKTFTCLVKMMEDLQCSGTGSSKKQAKKQAAEKMLDLLQDYDCDTVDAQTPSSQVFGSTYSNLSSEEVLDDSDLEEYYPGISPYSSPRSKLDFSDNFENDTSYNNSIKSTTKLDDNNTEYDELSKKKLESQKQSMGFNIEYIKLPNKSKKDLHQVFVKLQFIEEGKHPIVTHGTGETLNIAECKAADRARKHLELMLSVQ